MRVDLANSQGAQPTILPSDPAQDDTAQKIAELLLAGYAILELSKLVAALIPGVGYRAVMIVLGLTRTKHQPGRGGTVAGNIKRRSELNEIYYRAVYLINASARIQEDLDKGKTQKQAIAAERKIFEKHQAARNLRIRAANSAAQMASFHGDLLGWHINPLLNNETECLVANGHNFNASVGTVIGYPGAVHPNCGCVAGPPHEGAGSVDDAIRRSRLVRFASTPKVRMRSA